METYEDFEVFQGKCISKPKDFTSRETANNVTVKSL